MLKVCERIEAHITLCQQSHVNPQYVTVCIWPTHSDKECTPKERQCQALVLFLYVFKDLYKMQMRKYRLKIT